MVNNTKTNLSKMKFVEIFNIWHFSFISTDINNNQRATPMEIQHPKLFGILSVK